MRGQNDLGEEINCAVDVMVSLVGARVRVFVDSLSGAGMPESVSGLTREWNNGSGGCIPTNQDHERERERRRKEDHLPYIINIILCRGARGEIAGEMWDNVK